MKYKSLETLSNGILTAKLESYKGMFSKMFRLLYPIYRGGTNREFFFLSQMEAHQFFRSHNPEA